MDTEQLVEQKESIIVTLWELTRHILLVTGAFLIIFSVAIGLELLVRALIKINWIQAGTFLEWSLLGAKYALLTADLCLLAVLLGKYSWRAAKKF